MFRWYATILLPFIALICAKASAAEPSREVLFVSGDPAPMAGAGFTWTGLYSAYLDSEGMLAVDGEVAAPETGARSRIVTLGPSTGPFQRVAGVGDPLPGTYPGGPVTLRSLGAYGALGGRVLLNASLEGGGVGTSNDQAIVVGDSQGLQMVAREGNVLPGLDEPIVEFFGSRRLDHDGAVTFAVRGADWNNWSIYRGELGNRPQLLGQSVRPEILLGSRGGFAVVSAKFPDAADNQVVSARKFEPGGVSVIAEAGQAAPGLPQGWTLTYGRANSCNDAGQVLFMAGARNGSLPSGQNYCAGLWLSSANADGDAELIALNSPTGNGMSLDGFAHPAVNATGDVAYFSGSSLYLKRHGEAPQLVARPYMGPPPSANGASMQALTLDGLQLSANGNLVFASTTGLWVFTSENQLKQIIRIGETIRHHGVDYIVTDADLLGSGVGGQDTRRRMLSDRGHIAFSADLQVSGSTETRTAIIRVVLPDNGDPGRAPVAKADIVTFRSGAGVPVTVPVLANDADPNGDPITIHSFTFPRTGMVVIRGNQLRYTPNANFNGEDRWRYTIRDTDGNYSTAEVIVRNPFPALRGSYRTFIREDTTPVGTAAVNLSATGQVSGRVIIGGQTYVIRGRLRDDGSFVRTIAGTLTINLQVTLDAGGKPTLSGDVQTSSGATYAISETAASGRPPHILAQRITTQLRSSPDSETGGVTFESIGFATGKLAPSGKLIFVGRLPDNRAFTASTTLKRDGTFILSTAPYGRGRGALQGEFRFAGSMAGIDQWQARLQWKRMSKESPESGIDTLVDGTVASYEPGATWPMIDHTYGWPADFQASWNGETFFEFLQFDMGRAYVLEPNSNALKLHIQRSTGLVTGSFSINPANPSRQAFHGVLFAPRKEAAGIVPSAHGCGWFVLTEPQ